MLCLELDVCISCVPGQRKVPESGNPNGGTACRQTRSALSAAAVPEQLAKPHRRCVPPRHARVARGDAHVGMLCPVPPPVGAMPALARRD